MAHACNPREAREPQSLRWARGKVRETLSQKQNINKRARDVAQVAVQLTSVHKALRSIPKSTEPPEEKIENKELFGPIYMLRLRETPELKDGTQYLLNFTSLTISFAINSHLLKTVPDRHKTHCYTLSAFFFLSMKLIYTNEYRTNQ
jgi:hypothetical protein